MDFEEWWIFAKPKNIRTKYMARQGWNAAITFGCSNTPSEINKNTKENINEIKSLKLRINYLLKKIEKINSSQKLDHPQLFITDEEPPLVEYINWIKWWRSMRKINGLSFTMEEAQNIHKKLTDKIIKEIKKT